MIDENNKLRIERILPYIRRGTYYIIQAKLECSYDSVLSVLKRMKYWNEDIYKMTKKINALSDEEFAIELVRAKKKIEAEKKRSENIDLD
jgi:hypothetical protein